MPKTLYKIWASGPPVGLGVTGAIHVGMAGIAKRATANFPFILANEIICGSLARVLLLPSPPGALMEKEGQPYYFSLNFNLAGQSLPPAFPDEVVLHDPVLAWGIIVFDAWVMNVDRHGGNIAFDKTTGQIQIFDHSHAFVGESGDPLITLNHRSQGLGINAHCLASAINTLDGLDQWCDKVCQVPDYYISGIVDEACEVGLPSSARGAAVSVLKSRRSSIKSLIHDNIGSFPRLPRGAL